MTYVFGDLLAKICDAKRSLAFLRGNNIFLASLSQKIAAAAKPQGSFEPVEKLDRFSTSSYYYVRLAPFLDFGGASHPNA